MSLDAGVSALIGRIYESAHDAVAWTQVLGELRRRTGSRLVSVSAVDLEARTFARMDHHGLDTARLQDRFREFQEGFCLVDPTMQFAESRPAAGYVKLTMAVDRSAYDDHPFVRWFQSEVLPGVQDYAIRYAAPWDSLTLASSIFPTGSTHRQEELALFALLFPHIERAIRLAARPLSIEASPEALILVGFGGMILEMSDAATRLVTRGDGLTVRAGQLCASLRHEQRGLDATLRSALSALEGQAGGDVALARPSGLRPLLLHIVPTPDPRGPLDLFRPAALVRVVDPEVVQPISAGTRWTAWFGFTAAETRLVTTLLAGDGNLRAAAHTLGIAYATARVHLSHIFDKAGVRSQAQLARLLTRLEAGPPPNS